MASSKRPADSPNATRHMLDELDALMDRMLSLPINDAVEAPPPALAATLTVVPPEAEAKRIEAPSKIKFLAGRASSRESSPTYRTEAAEPEPAAAEDKPPEPVAPATWDREEPMPHEEVILPSLAPHPPPAKSYTGQRKSLGNVLAQPLLWVNQGYDRATQWLGPLGRWLRGPRGRACLGYLGLILVSLALAWGLRDWIAGMW